MNDTSNSLYYTVTTYQDYNHKGIDFRCCFSDERIINAEPFETTLNPKTFSLEPLRSKLSFSRIKSPFIKEVLIACQQIPFGETITYSELAAQIGRPKSYRAVGSALAKNPFFYLIPCHRVVGKNILLNYKWGSSLKEKLLRIEGRLI